MSEQRLFMPPPEACAIIARYLCPPPQLVVLSGPSGAGKDSALKRMRELGYPFRFVVTATTRPPRPGEVHGVDYCFVARAEFERMIAQDELFEYALVYDQYKGVPKEQVRRALASGLDVILRLDVQGTASIRARVPQVLTIFLMPPSVETLIDRLCRRAADSPQQVQRRLETALAELGRVNEFDYVVVNREERLDEAVQQIVAIITAEKCRSLRREVVIR